MLKITWPHVAITFIIAVAALGLAALLESSKNFEFEASHSRITLKATQPPKEIEK